jgi:signal transduction histidine kinase
VKIQTQARLLVAGIVMTPLLIFFVSLVHNRLLTTVDVSGLPAYEDMLTLLGEDINARDWESVTRIIARSRAFGEIAIVRDDYLVLYSTIREFTPGAFTSRETMLSMFDGEPPSHTYLLAATLLDENRIYVIAQATSPSPGAGWPNFAVFLFVVFIFIIVLAVFSVSMSLGITRTITRSVQVLENATRRVAEGELDLNVDVKGSNEITSLTKSLNKMRNALKEEELRRSRFIMGITHDLKTPLALIKGYAEAIEDGITADPAARTAATEIIAEKADQLEDMINDLLNYVRMETGEWRARLENVSLFQFLQRLIKTMGSDVELLQHTLLHDINLPENISIPMDERLVLRAFENLIHNAVRYTPQGSVIRVAAACREAYAELTVSDNGPGIERESLPHIFEMFYRGTSSRREQGLGLGLAVVKWVVDYHGWTISVTSQKGVGTCFTITVPLTQRSA